MAKFKLILLALTMAASLVAVTQVQPVKAASFIVNSTADSVDANLNDNICADGTGQCTLRAAIMQANFTAGDDTISLPATTFTLTGNGDDTAVTGDLDITSNITINGASATSTIINGGALDRVFHILSGGVTISNVTIQGGLAVAQNGGGIAVSGGSLTLNYSRVVSNSATAVVGVGGAGGGIAVTGGSLTLNFSSIGNGTDFSGNNADTNGGGLYFGSGTSGTVTNSTLSYNNADAGGGAYMSSGATVVFSNSTISTNDSDGITVSDGGGGLFVAGTATLNSATVAFNTTETVGGGVMQLGGTVNTRNTIISDNIDNTTGGGDAVAHDCSGSLASFGYNLLENSSGCSGIVHNVNGDIVIANITPAIVFNVDPLNDNGGQTDAHTLTHAISLTDTENAIAVDRANPAGCSNGVSNLTTDQRGPGFLRNENLRCDIGAFEFIYVAGVQSPTVTPTITFTPSNTAIPTSTFTSTLTNTPVPTQTLTATSTATLASSAVALTASATNAPKLPLFTAPPQSQPQSTIDFTATARVNQDSTNAVATALAGFPSFTPDFAQSQTAAAAGNFTATPSPTTGPSATPPPTFVYPAETGVLSMSQSLGAAGGRFQCGIWLIETAPGTVSEGSSIQCNTVSGDDTVRGLPDNMQSFWQVVDIKITVGSSSASAPLTQPVRTCAYYKPEYLEAAGNNPANFVIYTSDNGDTWIPLATTPDLSASRVCALSDHFSYYRLAAPPPESGGIAGTIGNIVGDQLVGVVALGCGLLLLVVVIIVVVAIMRRKPKVDEVPV
jgi:CSLREA domain-containing protein